MENDTHRFIARTLRLVACGLFAGSVHAAPYPTVDRVEYVLECMKNNGGSHEYLYKCSCAIDAIAAELPYEEYVEASTVARYQGMGGERAGVFRDAEPMKVLAKRFRTVHEAAKKGCAVRR